MGVIVPPGVDVGDEFTVDTPAGPVTVAVPEGCQPGSIVLIHIPDAGRPIELDESPLSSPRSIMAPESVLADGSDGSPGDVAFLKGERATLLEWNAAKGRWSVSIGKIGGDELPPILRLRREEQAIGRENDEAACDSLLAEL